MQKTFHIIGAGKVGHALALLLQRQGWQLAAVVSRSGRALWADCCGGRMVPCIAGLPRADVLIISTPDDAIATAAQEAAALPWLHEGVLALPEALSRELVVNLMRQSVDNVAAMPPAAALTGPIVRGDEGTVAAHLAALSAAEREAYGAWAQQTLALAAERLDEEARARVGEVLRRAERVQD